MTVSVIIPTWNRAKTLKKAIESALNQTVQPLEILVCDDGSTDESKEIVESINDTSVKWIEGYRAGRPAIPRNRGIKESKGEWLAFLDSDDEWLPEKLELQLKLAKELNCKASCTNAYRIIPNRNDKTLYLEYKKSMLSFNELIKDNYIICSSAIIHKSLIEKVEGFPQESWVKTSEDYGLWLRVAMISDFAYLDQPLVLYNDDPKTSFRSLDPDGWTQKKNVLRSFFCWLWRQELLLSKPPLKAGQVYVIVSLNRLFRMLIRRFP